MKKVMLCLVVVGMMVGEAWATTYNNSFNTVNNTVNNKYVYKQTSVSNTILNEELRRWDYGFYVSAPKLVAIPKADDLYFGVRFDGTGMFDRAVGDRYEVKVGFTYDGVLLNGDN